MASVKTRLRKYDLVQVLGGSEGGRRAVDADEDERLRGKRGRILEIDRERGTAIVEGVNLRFRHRRQSQDPARPGGGRVEEEAPLRLSNLMLVCPKCNAASRVSVRVDASQQGEGEKKPTKIRVCKACGADIPERMS